MKLNELLDVYDNWQIELCIYDKESKQTLYDGDLEDFAVWCGCGNVQGKTEECARILGLSVAGFVCDNSRDYSGRMIVTVVDNV